MKKLFLTITMAFMIKSLSALPSFICTSGGFLFEVTWYTDYFTGELKFRLNNMGPGSCSGGPWQMQNTIRNPNLGDGGQPPLASAELHAQFSNYNEPFPIDPEASEVKEAVSFINSNTIPTKSFNPNFIHATWAKSFALSNNQDIYFMKLAANPTVSHQLEFQIWSTKSQTVEIKLIDPKNGLESWSSTMELTEGKNIKSISLSTSITNVHIMQVTSGVNMLTANVIIN